MGLNDTVELPPELSLPGVEENPGTVWWGTKSIGMPAVRTLRVTAEGRLPEEEVRHEALLNALEADLDEVADSASKTDHGRGRRSDARAGVEGVRRYLDWRHRNGEE